MAAQDPIVQRLQTAPGVGVITALTYRAVVDDVARFADARGVAAYLGLVPREDRIIQGLKIVKSKCPVFMIDEVVFLKF